MCFRLLKIECTQNFNTIEGFFRKTTIVQKHKFTGETKYCLAWILFYQNHLTFRPSNIEVRFFFPRTTTSVDSRYSALPICLISQICIFWTMVVFIKKNLQLLNYTHKNVKSFHICRTISETRYLSRTLKKCLRQYKTSNTVF